MQIELVNDVLREAGLAPPRLSVLAPTDENYVVMLMQPVGRIVATPAGVRNVDRILARAQFSAFLSLSLERGSDVSVTPEYSMPWDVLVQLILAGHVPTAGKIWILGCESLTLAELEAIRTTLEGSADLLFEPLQAQPLRFLDPLAYVFATETLDGQPKVVVMVQFKTRPMGDPDHFETNHLQVGSRVLRFGTPGTTVTLVSLICSDVFAFTDPHAAATYDRGLFVHIQLNPHPRQVQYRAYRDRLFGFAGDATELICLNWAANVVECCDGGEKSWNNVSGSAWYLRPDKFDSRDATLVANHRRGMYYTWLEPLRSHALFFNYSACVFELVATKVSHLGVLASLARRRGPQVTERRTWDAEGAAWVAGADPDDGTASVLHHSGDARRNIEELLAENPLSVERLLTLTAGGVASTSNWHHPQAVESCRIDTSEVILRLTFCQDPDERAQIFRTGRMAGCATLWTILSTPTLLPASMKDLEQGFRLTWTGALPHQNVLGAAGPATAVYLGEGVSAERVAMVQARLADFLMQSSATPDDAVRARQRLAIYSRDAAGGIVCASLERYVRIDDAAIDSAVDITREQ